MNGNLLLIAFIVFAVLIMLVALFLRARTVDDTISGQGFSSISDVPFDGKPQKPLPTVRKARLSPASTSIGVGKEKPAFEFNRKKLNMIGKVLTAIGAVLIFAPLPSSLDSVGFGVAFIGYILTRFTSQAKKAPQNRPRTGPPVDMLRKLASKPEYRDAMRILSEDVMNKTLTTDADRQKRAIRYLQSKGISESEARRNATIIASYLLSQQKNK